MKERDFCRFYFFCLFFLCFSLFSKAQTDAIPKPDFRNNFVKLSLLPISQSINGHNQKWFGIEYERFLKQKISISITVDAGLFEDYTFIKYYDFFEEQDGFSYCQTDARTRGYHIIPALKYYFLATKNKKGQGFYLSGALDFSQYFKVTDIYYSATNSTDMFNSSTTRLSIGAFLGGQYVAFSRLAIDLNISIFASLFSVNNGKYSEVIKPLNALWIFDNNTGYSTVNLMIGYAFGGGKRK